MTELKFKKCLEYKRSLEGHCVPQADSYRTLLNVLDLLENSSLTEVKIAEGLGFAERQGNLYAIACALLGLAMPESRKSGARTWILTKRGRLFLEGGPALRKNIMTLAVVQVPVVHMVLRLIEAHPTGASNEEIDNLVGQAVREDDEALADATVRRRRHTVLCWLQWVGLITKKNDRWCVFYE